VRTELQQLHDRSVSSETPTAEAAASRVGQARADIERANALEADARQAADAAHAAVGTARLQGAPNVAALEADAARADTALHEIVTMAALVRLSAQTTIRTATDAGHVRTFDTLQPGDPPPADATPQQREAILEANRRFAALRNPRDARYVHAETPRLAWVEYLRQHGIDVPNATTVDTAHDIAGPSGGSIREQTTHPLDQGRLQVSDRITPHAESVIQADGDAAHPSVAREFHDGSRAPNVAGVSRQQAHAALAELVRTGAIPNAHPGGTASTISVRVGEGASARTIHIEVLSPSDTHGAIAQSDFGAHPDHIHVWISDRILDEHVPRALGGIIADVVARASGQTGSAAEAAGRQGQLRAMFAHLQALEAAPPPAPSSDTAAASRVQGRAESVGRIRAEIDLMLADMHIVSGDTEARRTALEAIQDPELRRLIDTHVGREHAVGFNPEAAAQTRTDAQRRAPEATATDQAAASGQVSASAVLPPPPTGEIHGFSAADYPRVVELRMHLEAIREMDARLAARDQSGAARDAAQGESLRRREHVDRVRALLAELQIGGTNQEFIRQRLAELNAVFPGTGDISQAVEQRVQRRLSAVSAHQRAEAFRQARTAAAQQLAESILRGPRPYTTERAIVGGGMAGTSRAAAVGTSVGADGHVDPRHLLMIGGDDMISGWAPDEHWGQRMGVFENSDHPMFSGATEGNRLGDVVEDPGEFMHVGELNDAMDLARQRLGLVPVPGRVLQVEVAPAGQATWTAEGGATVDANQFPVRLRVSINGTEVTIYTGHSDITTGLGNTGMPNEGILDPATHDDLLAQRPGEIPIVMGGERMMARDAPRMTGRVLVVAFGPTGAWAAYRAAELGAAVVDWGGTGTVDANRGALRTAAGIDRTQETFAHGDVQSRIHRTTDQIVSIQYDGGSGAIVTYAYPDSTPERPHVYRVRYDHVLMTQGFDSAGGTGVAGRSDAPSAATPRGDARVGSMIGGMQMQVQSGTDAPNIENSGAHAGAVTVYGGAAWDGAGLQTEAQRAELRQRQAAAAAANSADSPDARTMESMGRAVSAGTP
jgi:hypothetical protein